MSGARPLSRTLPDGDAPQPLDPLETIFQTARLTILRTLRGKRWLLALAIVALPGVIAFLATMKGVNPTRDVKVFFGLLSFLHFGIAVPGVALSFATSFPWSDADDGSLVWWFTAPVRRWAIHAGRLAAALAFGMVLLPPSVLLLALAVDPPATAGLAAVGTSACAATLLAFPAYLAIFWLASTFTRRGLVFGLIFIVIENFLSLTTGNLARITVIHYVRAFLAPVVPPSLSYAARALNIPDDPPSLAACIAVLASTAAVAAGLSLWLVERIEYRGKSSQAS